MGYRATWTLAISVLGFPAISVPPVIAQDFSDKPIRIIVGLAPGGATDVTARLIAQRLNGRGIRQQRPPRHVDASLWSRSFAGRVGA